MTIASQYDDTMEGQTAVLKLLQEHFHKAKEKNSRYSLRAFSSKIDVNPGTLSAIMNGKRRISIQFAEIVLQKLEVKPQETSEILALFKEK